jgi:hypothetical protein
MVDDTRELVAETRRVLEAMRASRRDVDTTIASSRAVIERARPFLAIAAERQARLTDL